MPSPGEFFHSFPGLGVRVLSLYLVIIDSLNSAVTEPVGRGHPCPSATHPFVKVFPLTDPTAHEQTECLGRLNDTSFTATNLLRAQ